MIRTGGTLGFISAEFRKNLASLSRLFAASANRRFKFHKRSQLLVGTHSKRSRSLVEIPGIAICLAEWRNMVLRCFQDGFLTHVHKYLGFLVTDPVDMLR